jgi:hypothetical protein
MDLFTLEHSKLAYRVDFMAYAVLVAVLALSLYFQNPLDALLVLGLWATAGLVSWSLMEYLLHRFVLHGMEPFRSWHTLHHQRPVALICTPTVLSAAGGDGHHLGRDAGLPGLRRNPSRDSPLEADQQLAQHPQALARAAPPQQLPRLLWRDREVLGPTF